MESKCPTCLLSDQFGWGHYSLFTSTYYYLCPHHTITCPRFWQIHIETRARTWQKNSDQNLKRSLIIYFLSISFEWIECGLNQILSLIHHNHQFRDHMDHLQAPTSLLFTAYTHTEHIVLLDFALPNPNSNAPRYIFLLHVKVIQGQIQELKRFKLTTQMSLILSFKVRLTFPFAYNYSFIFLPIGGQKNCKKNTRIDMVGSKQFLNFTPLNHTRCTFRFFLNEVWNLIERSTV